MPEKKDYYEMLGLKKGASVDDVKRAYKELAKRYHPDISKEPNAEEKFKEILEAYQVLSDPEKKANYDQFGHAFEGFQGFQGFRGFGARDFEFDFGDIFNGFGSVFGESFTDIFGRGFGTGTRTSAKRKGSSIRYDLNISFEEAAFGTEKEITFERMEQCPVCDGLGGKGKKTCARCKGSGMLRQERRTAFGIFATQSTCPECRGEGTAFENICSRCRGKGSIRAKKTVSVKIPAGIDTGNHLRLQGMGNAGIRGGTAGDLFVVLFVEPHKIFKRDGADIYAEVPISFSEAALGAKIDAPILKGEATITVPAGTQTGTIFRLRGKGMKELHSSNYGDEYVKVIVQVPRKMSKKYKELLEKLGKEETLAKERKGFFGKSAFHRG